MHNKFTISPAIRLPVRSDFPPLIDMSEHGISASVSNIIITTAEELKKEGLTLQEAPPIYIAFPQRMAEIGTDNRVNEMHSLALDIKTRLEEGTGKIWPLAYNIYQIHNNNSGQGNVLSQQRFVNYNAFENDDMKYTIALDDIVSTANTINNLISHLTYSGSKTLCAVGQIAKGFHFNNGSYNLSSDYALFNPDMLTILGKNIADAIEYGFSSEHYIPLPGRVENNWGKLAFEIKELGVDIRYLLPVEIKALAIHLGKLNNDYSPERISQIVNSSAQLGLALVRNNGRRDHSLSETQKIFLERQLQQNGLQQGNARV